MASVQGPVLFFSFSSREQYTKTGISESDFVFLNDAPYWAPGVFYMPTVYRFQHLLKVYTTDTVNW